MLKTFNILRTRWQEVLLIVGLQAAAAFAFMQATKNSDITYTGTAQIVPFAALLFVTFSVMAKMLTIGFARTSFADEITHYEPWPLLKIGYHYFWRLIGFEIMLWLVMVSIMFGLYAAAMLAGIESEKIDKEQLSAILLYCAAGGMLLIAKPMILGPAAIIVTDCGVLGAFGWLPWLRIFNAKKTLAAYIVWLALALAPSFLDRYGKRAFVENYAVIAGFSVLAGILTLIIYVTTVKAVGEVYISTHHSANGFGEERPKDTLENQEGGK